MLNWQGSGGFSVDASVRIEAEDRAGIERLVRYCARPPFVASRFTDGLESGVRNAWLDGEYAYLVVDGVGSGLHVLDISDPSAPRVVASYYGGSSFLHDVYVRDGLAFLSHWNTGLIVLDVGNGIGDGSPTDPREVSRVPNLDGQTHNAWYWPDGGYVFVREEDFTTPGRMHVVDFRDPTDPRRVATFAVPGQTPHNFWMDEAGQILYLAWFDKGVRALDASGELLGDLSRGAREVGVMLGDGPFRIFAPPAARRGAVRGRHERGAPGGAAAALSRRAGPPDWPGPTGGMPIRPHNAPLEGRRADTHQSRPGVSWEPARVADGWLIHATGSRRMAPARASGGTEAPMSLPDLVRELRRRRVFRVATGYCVVGWALVEIADTVFPHVGLPARAVTLVIALLVLGFPLAIVLAWGFELTRAGIRREESADDSGSARAGRRPPALVYVALGLPVLVASVLLGTSLLRSDPASSPGAAIGDGRPGARGGPTVDSHRPSLAVLPFANLGSGENDDFADGVAEDIRTQLGRLSDLRVIGRTSVLRYARSDLSATEIGGELGVSHVLEGSVQRAGDKLRITVRVVRVGSDEQLWGEGYDREAGDVFAIQTDIAQRVAVAMLAQLTRADRERIGARGASNLEAYEIHLAARALLVRRDAAGLQRAAELFREATRLDPAYAPAYVGLADAYILMTTWGGLSAREAAVHAREAAQRALELDPLLGEAWTTMAYVDAWFGRDWVKAEEGFRRAIELSPNYPTAHHWYAVVLSQTGRLDEAKSAIERAHELDPGSLIILTIAGLQYHFGREWDSAIEWHRRSLELESEYAVGNMWLAQAHAAKGELEEALAHYRRAVALDPDSPVMRSALAYGLGRIGDSVGAHAVLAELRSGGTLQHVPPHWLAQAYVGVGDLETALGILERGLDEGTPMANVLMEPLLDPLRGDARYESILEGLGLGGSATASRR